MCRLVHELGQQFSGSSLGLYIQVEGVISLLSHLVRISPNVKLECFKVSF